MYGPIEIRPSTIVLHNYDPGMNEKLEKMLSIWNKGKHKSIPVARYYDAVNRDLYVPRGLQSYYVVPPFLRDKIIYTSADAFDRVGKVRLKLPPRDGRQMEAIKFCTGMDQYHMNRNLNQFALNLDTGCGKTYVAIFTYAFYACKTIMITSSVDWLEQWRARILEYTDLRDDEIYTIAQAPSIVKLINGLKDHNTARFYLCTHSTLYSWGKTYGWNALRQLFQYLKIGIKIYDEAHLYFDNICRIDFFTNCWKTYYLTATPSKSDFYQNIIYQKSFETIPKISLFDEEIDPHTRYLGLLFNSHPNGFDIERCASATQYGFSIIEYINYFIQTDVYFKMLQIVLIHCFAEMNPGDRMMIYIGKNSAVMTTYYWLKYYYHNVSIGIYTSLVPKEQKRAQLEATIILTTTKSANALLDIPNLKKVCIFAEPFNSSVLAKQILGRTRNRDTELIELVDCGFTKIKEWYLNKKRNVYNKYATEVNELSYSEQEINQALLDIARRERDAREQRHPTLPIVAEYKDK